MEEILTKVRSGAQLRGLPSRGPAVGQGLLADVLKGDPNLKTATPGEHFSAEQVQLADAVLAAEQSSATRKPASPLQDTVLPASADRFSEHPDRPGVQRSSPSIAKESVPAPIPHTSPSVEHDAGDAADRLIEPAPVLFAAKPVAPGGTAAVVISLENEDVFAVEVAFFCTGLIDRDGALIPAERVSFQPQELTLGAGKEGTVEVHVAIPGDARDGVYTGLIRASKLDYLHAVLVVQVDKP